MFELVGVNGVLFAIRDTEDNVIDVLPRTQVCKCLNLGLEIGGVSRVSKTEFDYTNEYMPKAVKTDLSTDVESILNVVGSVLDNGDLDESSRSSLQQLYDEVSDSNDFYEEDITGTVGQVLSEGNIDETSRSSLDELYKVFSDASTDDSDEDFGEDYSDNEDYEEDYPDEDSGEDCSSEDDSYDEAFDDGYSDEDFGCEEEEQSTVNKLYSYLNDEQTKLLKRYYLWFSQRIFDEGRQQARTLQVTSNPRKLQKQKELNVMRNNGGMWAYAGFVDMGYRGADYCTLGHPLRYVHLAWDVSVSDIETSFFGEEYSNDIEGVINSSNCIKFGIDCISDFFEIDKEYADKLRRAQREAIKDMDFMCQYYEEGIDSEVINSFKVMDEIVNTAVKTDAKGVFLKKDYKCIIPKSLSSFYIQFRKLGMVVPKSLVQEIRDNLIGWEQHKFIGFRYPEWEVLSENLVRILGNSMIPFLDILSSYTYNSYKLIVRDYILDFFELKSCGYYEYNADTFKEEGGGSKPVKAQLYAIHKGLEKSFWSDKEYTFDYIKRLAQLDSLVNKCKDLVNQYNTPSESFSMVNNRYYLDDINLGLDFGSIKKYDDEFGTDLYTWVDDLKVISRSTSKMICKINYNTCYSLADFYNSYLEKYNAVENECEKYRTYALEKINERIISYNKIKEDEELERLEKEREEDELKDKKRLEEEVKKTEEEEAKNKPLSNEEIRDFCYKNKSKVKGNSKLKFPLTVLDTVHKTGNCSPKQMYYISQIYTELTGVEPEGIAKPTKINLDDRKDIETAIDTVLADPDLLEDTEDKEKVYAIITSIKKYRSISERQMRYAEIALEAVKE